MAQNSATYEQLLSSGDMNLISSEKLPGLLVAHASLTQRLRARDQQAREWARPYVAPLVRLSMLLTMQTLDKALPGAGTREDLIVALEMHKNIFAQQIALLQEQQASLTTLQEMLSAELKKTTPSST